MLRFDIPKWNEYTTTLISEEDVYDDENNDYGIEEKVHVTCLYGLHDDTNVELLQQQLIPTSEINVNFNSIDIFESGNYDVVKFSVSSDQLNEINKTLTNEFDYQTDFPDYNPHVTIAYVKRNG